MSQRFSPLISPSASFIYHDLPLTFSHPRERVIVHSANHIEVVKSRERDPYLTWGELFDARKYLSPAAVACLTRNSLSQFDASLLPSRYIGKSHLTIDAFMDHMRALSIDSDKRITLVSSGLPIWTRQPFKFFRHIATALCADRRRFRITTANSITNLVEIITGHSFIDANIFAQHFFDSSRFPLPSPETFGLLDDSFDNPVARLTWSVDPLIQQPLHPNDHLVLRLQSSGPDPPSDMEMSDDEDDGPSVF
ncbi:hypothetical protein VNI00_018956 [Paramarasmius palmivorus]|uniref:Uncharacterized protein n=1 Tax=Paramarasmius palmivorus TaxID=297713 RepID=A0AAW0AT44_9AGAR